MLSSVLCRCCGALVAMQVLAISRKGLQSRGQSEEAFLKPLDDIAASGAWPNVFT